ncbi:MAG: hypothetical protein H6739_34255 [Alphaproteobacteria bacterium]|nr:hypothetical protein [Alphaproteobacteria bacterium]
MTHDPRHDAPRRPRAIAVPREPTLLEVFVDFLRNDRSWWLPAALFVGGMGWALSG